MINLKERSSQDELMDDLHCSGPVVEQTLRELDLINRLLGGNQISIQALKTLVKGHEDKEMILVDLGCGGGDILINMAQWAKRHDYQMKFVGVDANENIVQYARENCKGYPEISFEPMNIFSKEFLSKKYDIVHSSLFTHHFTDNQLVSLFSNIKHQARVGMIINDLHRHWLAYYSIKVITSILSRSAMVKNDAAISVARAFKRKELSTLLNMAGLDDIRLSWNWAFRWKVIYKNPLFANH